MKKLALFFGILILAVIFCAIGLMQTRQTPKISYTIAVVRDTPGEEKARQFKLAKEVRVYDDEESMFNAVLNHDADMALTDYLLAIFKIKTPEYSDLQFIDNTIQQENVTVILKRDDNALRQAIDEGLKKVIQSGEYTRISRKYFGVDIISKLAFDHGESPKIGADDHSWLRVQRSKELRVAFSGQVRPFNFYNENFELTGFDVEIAEAVCKELGIKFIPIVYSQDEMIEGLDNRYYDCYWNSTSNIPSIKNLACISNPYYVSELRFIAKKGTKIKTIF